MKVLCVDGSPCAEDSPMEGGGEYNKALHEETVKFLRDVKKYEVMTTHLRGNAMDLSGPGSGAASSPGFDAGVEVQKWVDADVVVFQFPIWWMQAPWTVKKYLDFVLTKGHGRLWQSSASSPKPEDPEAQRRVEKNYVYATGCMMGKKKYLLSCTMFAPHAAFQPGQFFPSIGAKSIDDCLMPWHASLQYCGAHALPTLSLHEVDASLDAKLEDDVERLIQHLTKHLS